MRRWPRERAYRQGRRGHVEAKTPHPPRYTPGMHAEALAFERPALRGTLHLVAVFAAIAGTVWMLLIADSPTGYVSAAIFGASLMLLYGTSATYHQIRWPDRWRHIPKRLDHAAIFLLIASTYTPFCLNVSLAWGIPMLSVVWSLAAAGSLLKLVWPYGPRWFSFALYAGLGWVGVFGASAAFAAYATSPIALLIAGGMMYMVGGTIYALKRPDPWPRVFGFHEVFHSFVVAGSILHFAAIAIYII